MAEVFELGDQPSGVGLVVAAAVPIGAQVVRLRLSERGLAHRRLVRGRGEMTASTESRRQDRVRWLAAATSQARCARRRLYDVDGAIDDHRASVEASLRRVQRAQSWRQLVGRPSR